MTYDFLKHGGLSERADRLSEKKCTRTSIFDMGNITDTVSDDWRRTFEYR
jgi:hypothetical protein